MDPEYRRYLITHPEDVEEDEMSFGLLMAIFRDNFGSNCHDQTLLIGGYEFTCTMKPKFTGRNKRKEWQIRICSSEHEFDNSYEV